MKSDNATKDVFSRVSTLLLTGVIGVVVIAGVSCSGTRHEVDPDDIKRAQAALGQYKKELMGALTTALADGPEEAIHVCQTVAPGIAEDLSTAGVEMGRTSHRLRNPDNAPRPWMERLLADYVADPADTEPRAVLLGRGRFGYVEPIFVKTMCLTCHGKDVDVAVRATVKEAYPSDEAIGFQTGDFRGLFWVTMPLDESQRDSAGGE